MHPLYITIPSSFLETPRLLLKELNPEVLQQLYSSSTDEEIMQFYGLNNLDEVATEKRKFSNGLTMNNILFRHFLLIDKSTGEALGRCGYHTWHVSHSRAEIGYGMHGVAHREQGFMKEALAAVVAYGFEHMGLNRVEAFVGSRNIPSLKLVRGLGFTEEGTLREHYCKDGHIEDSVCFSLLKREFDVRKGI